MESSTPTPVDMEIVDPISVDENSAEGDSDQMQDNDIFESIIEETNIAKQDMTPDQIDQIDSAIQQLQSANENDQEN